MSDEIRHEEIRVSRDNARTLVFKGNSIAAVEHGYPERDRGRWSKLDLYRTSGGNFVAAWEAHSRYEGERPVRYSAELCRTEDAVIEFFGLGELAKELYAQAGIEPIEIVD